MSDKVGNISFYDSSGQSDFGFTKPYSEKTAELIDQEVNMIIAESYLKAKEVLKNNMKGLTELAELLLEKEVIFSEDLERIFGKRKFDVLKEEKEARNALMLSNSAADKTITEKKAAKSKNSKKVTEVAEVADKPVKKKVKKEKEKEK
jgi:cell division protease FtsH